MNIYSAVVGSKLLEAAVPDRCWARLWPRFNAGLDNGLGSMEGYAMSPVRCRVRQWPLYVLGKAVAPVQCSARQRPCLMLD